ncbi:MAG: hypothetical protein M1839_009048 [Geoglossum umbratile]|nr:MAG: hypothetical protein M1839_009048 [Geoglossum umbratile]
MSDDELDRDWVPNGRPQSTLARSFSAALNDLFMIDNSVDTLAVSIDKKKQAVSSQSQELEALEARLRQTEELLKEKAASSKSPPRNGSGHNSPRRRAPLPANFGIPPNESDERDAASPTSPLARFAPAGPLSGGGRSDAIAPPSGAQQDGSDFVMVDRTEDGREVNQTQDHQRNGNDELSRSRNRPPPSLSKH